MVISSRLRRAGAALVAVAVAATLASCGSGSAAATDFSAASAMGQIQARGYLSVAVPRGTPPFAGPHGRGFDASWAQVLADALRVDLKVTVVPTASLVAATEACRHGTGLSTSPSATPEPSPTPCDHRFDISFPTRPITEKAISLTKKGDGLVFVDPYLVGHQRLLVPKDSSVSNLADLAGQKVCQSINAVTEADLSTAQPDAHVVTKSDPATCFEMLRSGNVSALSTSEIDLLAMVASSKGRFEIVGDQLSTEGYGILVPSQNSEGLVGYANTIFNEAKRDGTWGRLFQRWIAPYEHREPIVPFMSSDEAAALFPLDSG